MLDLAGWDLDYLRTELAKLFKEDAMALPLSPPAPPSSGLLPASRAACAHERLQPGRQMLVRARGRTGEVDTRCSVVQVTRIRRQELRPARLGHQLAILDDRGAALHRQHRRAGHLPALVKGVVAPRMLGRC